MVEWKEYALITGGLVLGLLLACAVFVAGELIWPTPVGQDTGEGL